MRSLLVAVLTLSLAPSPAGARLVGTLEEPAMGGECVGVGNIRGWVYSTTGSALTSPFQVYVDGKKSIEVPCCASRGDVARKHEGAPDRSGFSGVLNFQLLAPRTHAIAVRLQSHSGEKLTLETTCTSRRIGADTLLSELDLDNDGEGYCETDLDDPTLICCEGVRTDGPTGTQICKNVCYRWDRATQGLVMSAGPVLQNPLCQSVD
jgi:hypothetical protein